MDFKINGLPWKLFDVDRDNKKLKIDDKPYFGITRFQDLEIYVDKTLVNELYRQTLIHELIHAFTFSYGVHLLANEETEESICDFMGAHFDEILAVTNQAYNFHLKEKA